MNRRVLIFVILMAAVLAAGMLFLSRRSRVPAERAAVTSRNERPPEAPPATPSTPAPTPEAKAPSSLPRNAEPARRPATPGSRSTPASAAPAAPASDSAMLAIDADVPGAQVFVDRVFVGKTPLTTTDVKVGSHRLNVSADGYDGIVQTLDVKPGMQQVRVKLREVRLNARIDVVHKHRMGSCRGTLIATPRGITYETTDKDDAFSAALADMDDFQVDYLEKNLRIRLKQGKRYDFTDPEGNADRLFVFHRDVSQARARLAKGDPPAGE